MRVHDFQKELKKKHIPVALIFNFDDQVNPNFYYFTQYDSYGCLAVPAEGKPCIVAPQMEAERARVTSPLPVIAANKKSFSETLQDVIGKPKIVGIDYGAISLLFHRSMRKRMKQAAFVDVSPIIKELRIIKTETELAYLKKACAMSDEILHACFDHFKKFKTEKDVYRFLDQETRNRDSVFSFEAIVASGSNASMPHHKPENTKLKKGFCVIDFGVKYKGYCSDTTRTVYLGMPTRNDLELYQFVLDAQEKVTTQYVPGKKCSELHDAAAKELGKYGKYFIHSLGHGVGVQIHEPPGIGPRADDILAPNMAVTNEPGVYFPKKLGIRIEDTILVTNKKPEIITKIPRLLRIIK